MHAVLMIVWYSLHVYVEIPLALNCHGQTPFIDEHKRELLFEPKTTKKQFYGRPIICQLFVFNLKRGQH